MRFLAVSGAPAAPPSNQSFPHGLVDFAVSKCSPASTVTLTITYPQPTAKPDSFLMYGPTPASRTASWYLLTGSNQLKMVGNVVTFTIVDGRTGDSDLTVNGTVVGIGGIATKTR